MSDRDSSSPTTSVWSRLRALHCARVYVLSLALIGAFGVGVVCGHFIFFKRSPETTVRGYGSVANVTAPTFQGASSTLDFQQFWDVWHTIKDRYVKTDVQEQDLFYGSIQGLVASLDDPHSIFFPPKQAEEFSKDISGEFEGIGAEIGLKNGQIVVISPLAESPAERAGLKAGDRILMIGKESTFGMDTITAVSKIRGASGTPVMLTLGREKLPKPLEITITRAKIIAPSLTYTLKPGNVAYIRISQFNQETLPRLEQALASMPQNIKGIVVDVRNDPGGYLQVAVQVASKWIKNGNVIVEEKGRTGIMNTYTSLGPQPFAGIKTVVLVNKGSASASEILAGALQDYQLATVVGETSFGKGSVQELQNFSDGSALKLTIAEWFTPNGRNINKEGIKPDIEVKVDPTTEEVGRDAVLDKALAIIRGAQK